jgi:hypothetical protein
MSSPSSEITLANLQYLQSKLAFQVSAFEHGMLVTKNRIILRNRKQILKYYIYICVCVCVRERERERESVCVYMQFNSQNV